MHLETLDLPIACSRRELGALYSGYLSLISLNSSVPPPHTLPHTSTTVAQDSELCDVLFHYLRVS